MLFYRIISIFFNKNLRVSKKKTTFVHLFQRELIVLVVRNGPCRDDKGIFVV